MALKWSLPSMLSDVSCQVLAAGEAELTRRELGAEETLSFLLLGGPLRLACHAFIVRTIFLSLVIVFSFPHVNILRLVCTASLCRYNGVFMLIFSTTGCRGLLWKRPLTGNARKAVPRRCVEERFVGSGLGSRSICHDDTRLLSDLFLRVTRLAIFRRRKTSVDGGECCHATCGEKAQPPQKAIAPRMRRPVD